MATDAQIAANRRNALRSTGPRTPEGKARSSRNHLVHGLLAKGLIEGESPEDLLSVYEDFRAQFEPQTPCEDALVERIALAYFRLARFTHVEAQLLQREAAEPTHEEQRKKYKSGEIPDWAYHAQTYDRVTVSFRSNLKSLHNLALYEARLERSFDRAMRELRLLQAQRLRQIEEIPAKPVASETAAADPAPEPQPTQQPAAGPLPPARKIGFEVSNDIVAGPSRVRTGHITCQPASPHPENPLPQARWQSITAG